MDKKEVKGQSHFIYDHEGAGQVGEQIMDAYNSGVIDQPNGQLDLSQGENSIKGE